MLCDQFGDHDGIGPEVLLQHPLGFCFGQHSQVYIADSYNHKVIVTRSSFSVLLSLVVSGWRLQYAHALLALLLLFKRKLHRLVCRI